MRINLNKLKKNRTLKKLFGKVFMITFGVSSYFLLQLLGISEGEYNFNIFKLGLKIYFILNLPIILLYSIFSIIEASRLSQKDESIFIVFSTFMRKNNFADNQTIEEFHKAFPEISKKKLTAFILKNRNITLNINGACIYLSTKSAKVRMMLIYSLFNIASIDNIYSIEEEKLIKDMSDIIGIPTRSYNIIKKSFLKKGLKEERKILEEEARRKTAKEITKSFLPYNAYKILGVSPTVTKNQLKKVYRNLAKKYHPDKFYGQDDFIVQQMETKFQEITEAYEIIKRYKNHN